MRAIVLALVLLWASPVDARLNVPRKARVLNRSGSACVWCSLETLARTHGIRDLEGLAAERWWSTGPGEVSQCLRSRRVAFKMVTRRDPEFLEKYADSHGLMVGVWGSHAIVLVHFGKSHVQVLDNSGPNRGLVRTWTRQRFDQAHDGWAVLIWKRPGDEP